jgi:two-component system sensor histidine kinase CpxA
MARRFPLLAKILLWFFLNLVLLGIALLVLFRAQFRFGWDWLLVGGASQRIEALSDLIVTELNEKPRAEWDKVLDRFGESYGLRFLVFRDDATQAAGESVILPPEVRARFMERRGPMMPRHREEPSVRPPFRGPFLEERRMERPFPREPRPKMLVRTTDPTRYWLLVRALLRESGRPQAFPSVLIAVSDNLSGGGLFFDFKPWLVAGAGAVVFSVLFWLPLVRSITRSIGQMTQATRKIADGRFDVRVDERRRDELGVLGQSVNQMAERLDGFVRGQKRFLGDIAHELCSPLAKLRVALGILEQRAEAQNRNYINSASEKAGQMAELVNELLSFSKASLGASTLRLEPSLVRDVAERAIERESVEGADLRLEIAEDVAVMAEPELLVRALANLLRNAIHHGGTTGPITLAARREGDTVRLTVTDSGPGVPETELAKIFDPFYRLDASRDRSTGGTGLGLTIVKTCVESCGGTVAARNGDGGGLEVSLTFPAVSPPD